MPVLKPRLFCYQPTRETQPKFFKENKLCCLSIANGTYLLTTANIYQNLNYTSDEIMEVKVPPSSVLSTSRKSEADLLNKIRHSGILERKEILGEEILFDFITGRNRHTFSTFLNDEKIEIKNPQFESDALYETKNKILLIEAKSGNKKYTNFNIRQLYFPFRYFYDKMNIKKEIINLFVTYDKKSSIIHVFKYIWEKPMDFLGLKCKGHYQYKLV